MNDTFDRTHKEVNMNSQMTRKAEKRLGVLRARAETLKARMAANAGKPAGKDAEQELLALEWAFDRIEKSYGPEGEGRTDADRFAFLIEFWGAHYKDKTLHQFLDRDSLRIGGMRVALDEAMDCHEALTRKRYSSRYATDRSQGGEHG